MEYHTAIKPYKRKVRWFRVIVLFTILAAIIVLFASLPARGDVACPNEYQLVIVKSGDSIWNLINEYNPDFSGNMDKAVYDVYQYNKLTSSNLLVGQTIYIPISLSN